MTTLQYEILRLVVIIASLAFLVAIIIVILWAAWWVKTLHGYSQAIDVPFSGCASPIHRISTYRAF